MLGSHNSFSYLPVKHWWIAILKPWYKCQNKTIYEQYNSGIRYFDVRVRYINDKWCLVHNKIVFNASINDTLLSFIFSNKCSDSDIRYIRIILDERKCPENSQYLIDKFIEFIKKLYSMMAYWNINIHIDPIIYWQWKNPFKGKAITPIIEDHSSVKTKWYQYILGTKWYANKIKHKYNEYKKSDNIYLVDYV